MDNVSWSEIEKIQAELNNLQLEISGNSITTEKFFEKKGDTVIYNMDLVKQYLQSCVEKEILKLNPAIIMAVQIALESQDYDVGVIDWLLWNTWSGMRKTVMIFQKQCWLKPDWIPWKETIKEILNILWNPTSIQSRKKAKQQMWPNPFPEEHKVVQPKFKEGRDYYLQNREEFIQNSDILQWPKLEATKPDQVWWIGSSMMVWFSGEAFDNKIFVNMSWIERATTRNQQRYWQKWQKGKLDENKLKEYCREKWIKSFVLYFGWNEAAISQRAVDNAYNDIKTIWEYLKNIPDNPVQPVLCTCIWEMREEHSFSRENKRIYPLKEFNEKIRQLWKNKGWPVLDYAKIDVGDVWYDKPNNTHPSNRWYKAMWQKIIDNLSK